MSCIEDIYDKLVVGHAIQLGHFCQTPTSSFEEGQITVMNAQNNKQAGEYIYSDYDYECGYRDQFLQLDEQTNYPGDRFTCLTVLPMPHENVRIRMPQVSVSTDWRWEDGEDSRGGVNPLCYDYEAAADAPHSGNETTTP